MDLDSAALWFATRDSEALKKARDVSLREELFRGPGRVAWRFLLDYQEKHKDIPPPRLIFENSGQQVSEVEQGVTLTYVLDRMHERAEFRALKYGLDKSLEHLEQGDQKEAVEEVHKLDTHLRDSALKKVRLHTLADVMPEVREMYERTKRGETGIKLPWPTMTRITMGLWPQTLTFFVARPGVGKCVHEDSKIIDPATGVQRTIREIYESEVDRVTTWSKRGGVANVQMKAKIDSGSKECLRVKTRTGREVTVTPEHPFLTPEGWRRADEMRVGMSLGVPAVMPFPENPEPLPSWEIDLVALLLTDGSYTNRSVGFSTADDSILVIAQYIACELGVDVKRVPSSKYDYQFILKGAGRNNPHPVGEILRRHGMSGKKAQQKTIPEAIFRLPREGLSQFISVFWMCDGYISRGTPEIVLSSRVMLEQMQSLLLRFGIQSKLSFKPSKCNGKEKDAWRLRVVSDSAKTFLDSMYLWGQKLENLLDAMDIKRNPNIGFPRVSDEFVEKVKTLSKSKSGRWRGGAHEKVAQELGRTQFQTRDLFGNNNSLKMTAFKGFCKVYGLIGEFQWLWDSDLFWDEIEEVKEVGVQKVYDLTVWPTKCFVANDIVVHNTMTLINIGDHAHFVDGHTVLIVSPEMSRIELGERHAAIRGKHSYGDIVSGTLGMFAEPKYFETIAEIEKDEGYWILDDEERLEPSYIEEAIYATDPDLVLVDSVYMLRVAEGKVKSGAGSRGSRQDRILSTVDWLRSLCRKTNKPFAAVSQLSRVGEVKKGAKVVLKKGTGSGGLENAVAMTDQLFWDAHNLFAMYQDDDMRDDKQMLYVPLKARRQAQISSVVTRWDMTEMNFEEIGTKVESEKKYEDSQFEDVVF